MKSNELSPITWGNMKHLAITSVLFGASIILLQYVGYLLAGGALVASLMLYMRAENFVRIIATSILAPLVLYGVFQLLLGIQLP